MADSRVVKLAQALVNYSIPVRKGDWFVVRATDLAAPLIREVYREAVKAGANVDVRVGIDGLDEIFFKHASDEQLTHISAVARLTAEKANSTLNIMSDYNLKSLSGIDPARQALAGRARADLSRLFMQRDASGDLRWCITLYPTNASAQEAGMSLAAYEEFVYGAMLLDSDDPVAAWQAQAREQQRLADALTTMRELRILGEGTDLHLAVTGRTWINGDGTKNFPDGEVFSAPIEDSVSGVITYTYPAIFNGREVDGVRLTFDGGRVVKAEARQGEAFLNEMLNMDAGARVLGEIGIGTNYGIQKFTKNMLFDEKIGGTVHLALGAAYAGCGGKNESSLHWDMLVDLRRNGEVQADGRTVMKDGKWLV
ncbi:MAG: aminopeptidase [Chloroflexi bacterium]|nr:aminopeptidase [Chloroflexota bacterium]